MQNKHELGVTLSVSLILIMFGAVVTTVPLVKADWPSTFERYGPRVDKILIKLYSTESIEYTAFESGDIDLIDWPLTKYWINRWTGDSKINMMDYGGELGANQFDINLNETKPESTPAGAATEYGTEPNIGANFAFRHAVAHLTDRAYITSTIVEGFGVPIYTMVPPAMGRYVNTGVDKHPYSPDAAADILAGGEDGILGTADDIKDNDGDGYYDWPSTTQRIVIDFVVRDDHTPGRKEMGDRLVWELTSNLRAVSGGVGFQVARWSAWGSVGARKWVMAGKSFTIYTGGWILTRDPDFLFGIYHSSMYWHPGRPPNYANVANAELDTYLEGIYYAETYAPALTNTLESQRVMAEKALVIPTYVASAPKAGRTTYTGGTNGAPITPDDGENLYRGKAWKGFSNEYGKGLNSWWSFLDAHPEGYEVSSPGTQMVIRYGFKVPELSTQNPVYSEWYWDWEVLGKIYESLFAINPYDASEDLQRLAKRWEVGVWDNNGVPATRLTFELKNDWYWHDGVKVTADDVLFTFVELVEATASRGLPPPWYYSNLLEVNSVEKENDFKVTVKMNVLSYFAFHWIGGNTILPAHIWRPIMFGPDEILGTPDDDTHDPTLFSPDKHLIGAGPFKVYPHSIDKVDSDYYIPYGYVLLDAYKPASPGPMDFQPVQADSIAIHGIFVSVYVTNFDVDLDFMFDLTVNIYNTNNVKVAGPWTQTGLFVPATNPSGNNPAVRLVAYNGSSLTKGVRYIIKDQLTNIQMRTSGSTPGPWQAAPTVWVPPEYSSSSMYVPTIDGDTNNDRTVDIADATFISFHFGFSTWIWPEGDAKFSPPGPYQGSDAEYTIDTLDATLIMRNFFKSA